MNFHYNKQTKFLTCIMNLNKALSDISFSNKIIFKNTLFKILYWEISRTEMNLEYYNKIIINLKNKKFFFIIDLLLFRRFCSTPHVKKNGISDVLLIFFDFVLFWVGVGGLVHLLLWLIATLSLFETKYTPVSFLKKVTLFSNSSIPLNS